MHRLTFCVAALALAGCPSPGRGPGSGDRGRQPGSDQAVETVELVIGEARLGAEVVRTAESRTRGLMFRQALAPDSGMLFVFDSASVQQFWMKNTWIPLDIAFIESSGVITDILQMATLDTVTPYRSSRPVLYALETNQGWFVARGIRPGDTLLGIPGQGD
ncbi:DUF192 domain-containing protein [candidate division WOR-3 bacterium]|nr:DUF192 domain-containing protein [candidate division WOR-3 bacterium]